VETANKTVREMRGTLTRPVRAGQFVIGVLGVTFAYPLTLAVCLNGVSAEISTVAVIGVYLAAEIIGSASPTPGGLGVVEGALVAGLRLFDVPANQAVAAVLLFRLLTFWWPILPGLVAFRYLEKEGKL
jgi:glycosyltransferase 2 family protein